jgi:hypothetical protein
LHHVVELTVVAHEAVNDARHVARVLRIERFEIEAFHATFVPHALGTGRAGDQRLGMSHRDHAHK